MKRGFLILILFGLSFPLGCFAADTWPGGAGTTIATLSEPSGIVWHEERQSLFVVLDSGVLKELNTNGAEIGSWIIPGGPDLEGVTLAQSSQYLYLGVENPDSIWEFDLQTNGGELTGKNWDITTWMASVDPNQGLEGLSYRSGYFLAGMQEDGKVYIFNVNLNMSGDVSYVSSFKPYASYTDISGIDYNSDTGIVYSIFDGYDALIELNSSNEVVEHYALPADNQEGVAVKTSCLNRTADVYVAEDNGGSPGHIIKYTDYPITCLDADEDGVEYTSDCNDYDASISANQNYFRDIDSDGLGDANTTTQACSNSAPEGYVANSSDPADISLSDRLFYINGRDYDLFGTETATVQYIDLNFFSDDFHEVIAVGLTAKRAYVTVARVEGNSVSIVKRRMLKKKYRAAEISTDISKNRFTTRFNEKKRYVWKMKSSGSFKR